MKLTIEISDEEIEERMKTGAKISELPLAIKECIEEVLFDNVTVSPVEPSFREGIEWWKDRTANDFIKCRTDEKGIVGSARRCGVCAFDTVVCWSCYGVAKVNTDKLIEQCKHDLYKKGEWE